MADKIGAVYVEIGAMMGAFNAALAKAREESVDLEKRFRKTNLSIADAFMIAENRAKVFGDATKGLAEKQAFLKAKINELIEKGVSPASEHMQLLVGEYNKLTRALGPSSSAISKYGMAIAGVVTARGAGLAAMGGRAISAASDLEMLKLTFKNLLGSASSADQMLQQIRQFAVESPFTQMGLADAAKQLLGFGVAAQEIIPTLNMLGNASQGNEAKLGSLAMAFGQVRSKGRADMQDLYQFVNAGVPVFQLLADQAGLTVPQIQRMASAGQISFPLLQSAIHGAYSEGGRFGNLMAETATTVQGKWSTLGDTIDMIFSRLGEQDQAKTKAFLDMLIAGAEEAGEALIRLNTLSQQYNDTVDDTGRNIADLGRDLYDIIAPEIIDGYNNVTSVLGRVADAIAPIASRVKEAAASFLSMATSPIREAFAPVGNGIKNIVGRLGDFVTNIRPAIAGQAEMNRQLREGVSAAEGFASRLSESVDSFRQAMITGLTQASAAGRQTQSVMRRSGAAAVSEARNAREKYSQLIEEFGLSETEMVTHQYRREREELLASLNQRHIDQQTYDEALIVLDQQRAAKMAEIRQKEQQQTAAYAMTILSTVGSMVSKLGNLFSMYYSNRQAEVDNNLQVETDALDAKYAADQTRINSEITDSAAKAAALKALDEQYARDKKALEDKAAKDKAKLEREAAKRQKALAIADVLITTPAAAMQAFRAIVMPHMPWTYPLGLAAAAATTALGLAKLKLIMDTPLPAAAEGIYAESPYIGGEAGPELAFPLSSERGRAAIALLAEGVVNAASGSARQAPREATVTESGTRETMIQNVIYLDGAVIHESVSRATFDGRLLVASRAVI